jgi:hypothetical protein
MKTKHLGHGIVLFENAFDVDTELVSQYMNYLRSTNEEVHFFDTKESSEAVNTSGYKFDKNEINLAPERFIRTVTNDTPKQFVDLIQSYEDTLYSCLVEYCKLFPVAVEAITWRSRGSIATYKNGQHIGPHSDSSIPCAVGEMPTNQIALHTTLTASLVMNNEFEGGEIGFRAWDKVVHINAGSILYYPSTYIGAHEVLPVTSGERIVYLERFCHGHPGIGMPEVHDNNLMSGNQWLPMLKEDVGLSNMYQQKVDDYDIWEGYKPRG